MHSARLHFQWNQTELQVTKASLSIQYNWLQITQPVDSNYTTSKLSCGNLCYNSPWFVIRGNLTGRSFRWAPAQRLWALSPCSEVMNPEHRPSFCRPSLAMVTFLYELNILKWNVKQYSSANNYFTTGGIALPMDYTSCKLRWHCNLISGKRLLH